MANARNSTLILLGASFFLTSAFAVPSTEKAPNPVELMKREENHNVGKTITSKMTMTIDPDGDPRTLEVASWMQGYEKSLLKLIKPVKDKNQGNLKLSSQLWQYLPKVDRIIKIPSSMMLQSWMGSDFTNDDLVKGSRLSKDYTLKLTGKSDVDGVKVHVIEAQPKPDAPVVWGKIIEYVTQAEAAFVKREFYNEKQVLIKTLIGTEIKTFNGHTIPTTLVMTNHEKKGRKTKMQYWDVVFDQPIAESTFTQEHLRKPVF